MTDCFNCGTPTDDGKEFCTRSCAIEAEYRKVGTSIPSPPKMAVDMQLTVADKPAGLKFDDGKISLHLLPFDSLIEIAKVLQFGAKKYAPNNWRKGIMYSRLFRAAIGHCISWWMGEDRDPETGLSHLAHAGCCIVFLLHYVTSGGTAAGAVLDDRKEHNA
jgi:hypothetical protein